MLEKNQSREESGSPLLLIPGLICDGRIFEAQVAAFPQARIIADSGQARSLGEMAEQVLAAAPPHFALLGHSMGARIALEIYRQAPGRVGRLALISTGVHPVAPGEADKRHALRDLGRSQGMAALVDAWLPPMVAPEHAGDAALMTRLRTMCVSAGLARYEVQAAALLSRPEVESLLPSIAVPTLVATGSEDRWSPPDQHRTIAAAIADADLQIIAGAGHMLPAEAPALLNAAIGRWLARPVATEPASSRRE
ncbi:alpha/beta fold hydrolase [Sphingomonas sp. ASY06-1R]|uniref:alpha/beta fold hydrolase n=1 Tax=Sphingomonas sp. ASY06-1R TaxID=3445771 RepID=UPI003FA1AAFF